MKNWKKIIIIIAIILVVIIVGVEIAYHSLITDCCSICGKEEMICPDVCGSCNYNTFEKIERLIEYFKELR